MKQFLHLWVPIFLSNAIIMLSGLFDVIFLSHFSPQHVAALAVCLSVYSLCFVLCDGYWGVTGHDARAGRSQWTSGLCGHPAYCEAKYFDCTGDFCCCDVLV